jgi:hypothetical protein
MTQGATIPARQIRWKNAFISVAELPSSYVPRVTVMRDGSLPGGYRQQELYASRSKISLISFCKPSVSPVNPRILAYEYRQNRTDAAMTRSNGIQKRIPRI